MNEHQTAPAPLLRIVLPGVVSWSRPRRARGGVRYPAAYARDRDAWSLLVAQAVREARWAPPLGARYHVAVGVAGGRAVALNQPTSVAVGADGAVYIADSRNGLIRRLDPANGALTTVAGNAGGADGGEGAAAAPGAGPLAELRARNARLSFPEGVAAGADGTLYVADTGAHRVRAVTPDGALVTLAGPRACPTLRDDLTCPAGETGDGGPAAQALLRAPRGVAVDAAGRVLVADTENNRVRLLTPAP